MPEKTIRFVFPNDAEWYMYYTNNCNTRIYTARTDGSHFRYRDENFENEVMIFNNGSHVSVTWIGQGKFNMEFFESGLMGNAGAQDINYGALP